MHHIKKEEISLIKKKKKEKGRNIIPNNIDIISADPSIPTRQKIHHPSRHNPLYPKHLKYHDPQLSRYHNEEEDDKWFPHSFYAYNINLSL